MDANKITIAVPFYPSNLSHGVCASLQASVQRLAEAGLDVCVVTPSLKLPENIGHTRVLATPYVLEPESSLPKGWLAAVQCLREQGKGAMMLVDCANGRLRAETVTRACKSLARESRHVLLGLREVKDHPCQFNRYFDIFLGHSFVPVDAGAEDAACEVRAALGETGCVRMSVPFRFDWGRYGLEKARRGSLYVFLANQVTTGIQPLTSYLKKDRKSVRDLVILRAESGTQARQAVFDEVDLAALPMLLPHKNLPCRILRSEQQDQTILHLESAAPSSAIIHFMDTSSDRWTLAESAGNDGSQAQIDSFQLPPMGGEPFLMSVLVPAELPIADIEVPYETGCGAWDLSTDLLTRVNCATGKEINGRQDFPEVYELDGSLLGLRGVALGDPCAALSGDFGIISFLLSEKEVRR